MANPVMTRNPVFGDKAQFTQGSYGYGQGSADQQYYSPNTIDLEHAYAQPAATPLHTDRMTYDDVLVRTGIIFAVLLVGAALGWVGVFTFGMGLAIGAMLVAFVLAMVNSFRREPSPVLISAYAVFEGVFIGGFSAVFELFYPGIVMQSVLGTLVAFAVTLLMYKSGKVRVTPKFQRILSIGLTSYLAFSLVSIVLVMTGLMASPWGSGAMTVMGMPLGFFISILAVALAVMSLISDFDYVQRGVEAGVPSRYAWSAAFGLMVTLIWLYVEILRILAVLRDS